MFRFRKHIHRLNGVNDITAGTQEFAVASKGCGVAGHIGNTPYSACGNSVNSCLIDPHPGRIQNQSGKLFPCTERAGISPTFG